MPEASKNAAVLLTTTLTNGGEDILLFQYTLHQNVLFSCEGKMQEMQVLSDDTYILILAPIPKPSDDYEPMGRKVVDMYGLSGAFYISEPVKIVIKDKLLGKVY